MKSTAEVAAAERIEVDIVGVAFAFAVSAFMGVC